MNKLKDMLRLGVVVGSLAIISTHVVCGSCYMARPLSLTGKNFANTIDANITEQNFYNSGDVKNEDITQSLADYVIKTKYGTMANQVDAYNMERMAIRSYLLTGVLPNHSAYAAPAFYQQLATLQKKGENQDGRTSCPIAIDSDGLGLSALTQSLNFKKIDPNFLSMPTKIQIWLINKIARGMSYTESQLTNKWNNAPDPEVLFNYLSAALNKNLANLSRGISRQLALISSQKMAILTGNETCMSQLYDVIFSPASKALTIQQFIAVWASVADPSMITSQINALTDQDLILNAASDSILKITSELNTKLTDQLNQIADLNIQIKTLNTQVSGLSLKEKILKNSSQSRNITSLTAQMSAFAKSNASQISSISAAINRMINVNTSQITSMNALINNVSQAKMAQMATLQAQADVLKAMTVAGIITKKEVSKMQNQFIATAQTPPTPQTSEISIAPVVKATNNTFKKSAVKKYKKSNYYKSKLKLKKKSHKKIRRVYLKKKNKYTYHSK